MNIYYYLWNLYYYQHFMKQWGVWHIGLNRVILGNLAITFEKNHLQLRKKYQNAHSGVLNQNIRKVKIFGIQNGRHFQNKNFKFGFSEKLA